MTQLYDETATFRPWFTPTEPRTGTLVMYAARELHRVTEVARGPRHTACWLTRDEERREP